MPLQTSASPHACPLGTGVCTQPVAGLQESLVQTFESSQFTGSLVQVPFRHRSFVVHRLLSAQSASLAQQPGMPTL
jgi:hypothetical protein